MLRKVVFDAQINLCRMLNDSPVSVLYDTSIAAICPNNGVHFSRFGKQGCTKSNCCNINTVYSIRNNVE